MKITVLNTGGTFNKVYNPIKGELEVPKDNIALDEIISNCFNIDFEIKNIISKDSLEITNEDREFLYQTIKNTHNENIIIVHGTDTIDITSKFLDEKNNIFWCEPGNIKMGRWSPYISKKVKDPQYHLNQSI